MAFSLCGGQAILFLMDLLSPSPKIEGALFLEAMVRFFIAPTMIHYCYPLPISVNVNKDNLYHFYKEND